MRALAVIPARLGATRLPRKPLRLISGTPLIVRVWERVSALGTFERCVIASDSGEVLTVARTAGAESVLTDAHHPSGTDRVAEVVSRPEYASYEIVVNIQGDEPFVSGDSVGAALAMVAERGFELGTAAASAAAEVLDDPNVVKVVAADDGRALYFSRAPIPYLRDPADEHERARLVRQHVGVYAYTRAALERWVGLPVHPLERAERLEQLRPLAAGMRMGVGSIEEPAPRGIDTEDDLIWANEQWSALTRGRG